MKNYNPKVSIVVATYNAESYLQVTIDSIKNIRYKNIELIIVDGGSIDKTVELINENSNVISFWISELDAGIYDAWNKGLNLSSGEWICFLGAGDVILRDSLSTYIEYLESFPSGSVEYVSSQVVETRDYKKYSKKRGKAWYWRDFRRYMTVAHPGSLHNRALYLKYGIYDSKYKVCGDYEFLLRAKNLLKAEFLNFTSAIVLSGGISQYSIKAIYECEKAKILTGSRGILISRIERYIAILKWYIKKIIYS